MNFPPNFIPSREAPRFVYRHFAFDAGKGYEGHTHTIDHPTIVAAGAVFVEIGGLPGKVVRAPGHFIAKADVEHRITAVQDGTVWLCVFPMPDGYDPDRAEFWNEA